MNKCLNFNILEIIRSSREKGVTKTVTNKYHDLLVCRLEGKTILKFGKKRISVERGEILYIPKDASYFHKCLESETVVSICLDTFGPALKEIKVYSPDNPDEVCAMFEAIYEAWSKKSENFAYLSMSLLYQIIYNSGAFMQTFYPFNSVIQKAVDLIDIHFSAPDFSFEMACKSANVSRSYFNRIFKKEYGMTPVEYLQKKRIDKAILLLSNGTYSREEIATLCGFNDVKYFYTVFKKITGTSTKDIFDS